MKNSKNLLVRYLSIFLIFGSINIIAQDNDEAIEEVVVTGSYIKGSPTDGASPVEIISRDTIDALSASTVADIIANIAVNSCLLYTSPSPRDPHLSRMPSAA